jgi:hypothetical protein
VPVFKLEAEDGTWLTDIRVVVPNQKLGASLVRDTYVRLKARRRQL